MTKTYAADVIKGMLFEDECNSAWIDFSSENEEDVEKAEE